MKGCFVAGVEEFLDFANELFFIPSAADRWIDGKFLALNFGGC